jgi:hypothetical protein
MSARQVEEIDFLGAGAPGANFGWSYYEGDHRVCAAGDRAGATSPRCSSTCTPRVARDGGLRVSRSGIPALAGYHLFADFCSGRVWMMKGPAAASLRLPSRGR